MAPRSQLPLLARGALLLLTGATATSALWDLCRGPAGVLAREVHHHGSAALTRLSFEQALTGGCAAVLMACALWLAAVAGLTVVAEVARVLSVVGQPTGRALDAVSAAADRTCPRLVRAIVTTALGVTATATIAAPAPADVPVDPPGGEPASTGLTGLALPDRTVGAAEPVSRRAAPRRPDTVVVHGGDSLWSIAAARLPDRASEAAITGGWHRLYRANAARIGADPDLILPGTSLVVPRLAAPRRKDHP